MNAAEAKERRKAWQAQARTDLRNPRLWIFMACLYVVFFLLGSLLVFVLNLIVPYFFWLPKPYVKIEPAPLLAGFYMADLLPATMVVLIPLLYIMGGEILFLSKKQNDKHSPK